MIHRDLNCVRYYYVENLRGFWFVVNAATKRKAYSIGVSEFGRGMVRYVRVAIQDEIDNFVTLNGENMLHE